MGEKQETLKESRKNSDGVIVIPRCVCLFVCVSVCDFCFSFSIDNI